MRFSVILFFFLALVQAQTLMSQCTVDLGPDKVICPGGSTQLNATGTAAFNYTWTPASGLSSTSVQNPVASPGITTVYYVTADILLNTNLIVNGNFSSGNTGFSSSYIYNPTNVWNEGTYAVTTNPHLVHTNFSACTDHTTGTGNMMVINGAGTPNISIWCETIPVTPNTAYAFSTWLCSVTPSNPAILQFSINGIQLGSTFGASTTTCVWQQFYQTWNSGSSTSATICIVNQNTATSGNDFALDDIKFSPFCSATDSVRVTVDHVIPNAGNDSSICQGVSAILTASGGNQYHWNTGQYQQSISVSPNITTSFTVTVTDQYNCTAKDSVKIFVNPLPNTYAGGNASICSGSSISLGGLPVSGHTYSWTSNPPGFGSTLSNPLVSPLLTTIYTLNEMIVNTGCSKTASITITVNSLPLAFTGPGTSICSGTPVTIGGAPVNGNSYNWTSTPPGFSSTVSNPMIFPSTTTQYNLLETNLSTGCSNSNAVMITVNLSPTVTLNPFSPVCDHGGSFALTGGSPPGGGYSGTGVSGGIFDPASVSPGTYNITYTYTNSSGCTGAKMQTITVLHKPVITGFITYDNVYSSPLDSALVILKNSLGIAIDSVFTKANGSYAFNCLDNGTYRVSVKPRTPWGGANATDAMIISRYAVGLTTLSGLRLQAGDVNLSGSVNAGDSYLVMRRWALLINSFPAGDWVSETNNNVVINNMDAHCNLIALCMGDVNGSYIPPTVP